MENTKIGNKEAIALLTTISFNQIIIFGVKSIINNTSSASLLNLLYLSIIILIFTILICYLLNKFPSFDLLDISDYLGGKILKWIVGILFFIYFIIFAGNSLHLFSHGNPPPLSSGNTGSHCRIHLRDSEYKQETPPPRRDPASFHP